MFKDIDNLYMSVNKGLEDYVDSVDFSALPCEDTVEVECEGKFLMLRVYVDGELHHDRGDRFTPPCDYGSVDFEIEGSYVELADGARAPYALDESRIDLSFSF